MSLWLVRSLSSLLVASFVRRWLTRTAVCVGVPTCKANHVLFLVQAHWYVVLSLSHFSFCHTHILRGICTNVILIGSQTTSSHSSRLHFLRPRWRIRRSVCTLFGADGSSDLVSIFLIHSSIANESRLGSEYLANGKLGQWLGALWIEHCGRLCGGSYLLVLRLLHVDIDHLGEM